MFSDWKQALYEVKDGIETQRRLGILYLIWIVVCTWWGMSNNISIHKFYHIEISMADLLVLQQNAWYTGIMVFPFAVFLVMKCKQNSLNVQYIVRYGKRSAALRKQVLESVWYSMAVSLSLIAVQLILGGFKNGTWINWDSVSGLYYYKLGIFSDLSVIWVIAGVALMYFIKFLMVFVCVDILNWYPKAMILIWILLVLFVGVEGWGENSIFYNFFAIRYELWQKPLRHIIRWGCGAACVGIEYLCGRIFVRRKDIFG